MKSLESPRIRRLHGSDEHFPFESCRIDKICEQVLPKNRERETQFGKEVLKDFKSLSHFNFFKSRLEDPPSSGVRHSNVQNRGSEEFFEA